MTNLEIPAISAEKLAKNLIKSIKRHFNTSTDDLLKRKEMRSYCIWGKHGMGKSAIAKHILSELQPSFDEELGYVELSPEKLEAEGDLLGFPKVSGDIMNYAVPDWTANFEKKHGIFLIDDFNRANPTVIKALKEVIYQGDGQSWKVPKSWVIIVTSNPSDENYMVSELDEAFMTRVSNYEMEFSVDFWMKYAYKAGFNELAIDFVRKYGNEIFSVDKPDVIRCYTSVLYDLKGLDLNKKEDLDNFMFEAAGRLSSDTLILLKQHLTSILAKLPSSDDILQLKGTEEVEHIYSKFFDTFAKSKNEDYNFNDIFIFLGYKCFSYMNANADSITIEDAKKLLTIVNYEYKGNKLAKDFWQSTSSVFLDTNRFTKDVEKYIVELDSDSILQLLNL